MKITEHTIDRFLETVSTDRIDDIKTLVSMAREVTGYEPQMWGTIIGFGDLHYKYKTGTEGDMPVIGFTSRKQAITLYLSFTINDYPHLKKLGNYQTGKGCLYIKKLSDVNLDVLKELMIVTTKDALELPFVTINS